MGGLKKTPTRRTIMGILATPPKKWGLKGLLTIGFP